MSLIQHYPQFVQRTNESLLYDVDFSKRFEFASRGAAITGTPVATINETTGTIASIATSTSVVQLRFEDAAAGTDHGIEVVIVTDQGDTIDGYLTIRGAARG